MPKTRGGKEISEAELKKLKQTGKMVSAKTGRSKEQTAVRAAQSSTAPAGRSAPSVIERIMRARSGGQITAAEAARLRAMTARPGFNPRTGGALIPRGTSRPTRQSTRNLTSEQRRARTQRQIQTRQRGLAR